jgi:hypothetical protein
LIPLNATTMGERQLALLSVLSAWFFVVNCF